MGLCEWRLEQESNWRKSAFSRGPTGDRSHLLRRKSTEQDCYGQGIHFDAACAQKWAQFENLPDFLATQSFSKLLILLAPQVGLEPTTLRLTARILRCSAMLDIALSCLFLCCYNNRFDEAECRDYPEIPAILKECPYKNPYSDCGRFRFANLRFTSVSQQLDERPGFGRQLVPWNQIAGHLAICNRKSGLGECIGDNALIKKAATSQLAAITCPSSRFYSQVDWIRKHRPALHSLSLDEKFLMAFTIDEAQINPQV
jgi:hypothetical protein